MDVKTVPIKDIEIGGYFLSFGEICKKINTYNWCAEADCCYIKISKGEILPAEYDLQVAPIKLFFTIMLSGEFEPEIGEEEL